LAVEPRREPPSEPSASALVEWAPNGTGQPRAEITSEGAALVQRTAAAAHSLSNIAAALGVSRRTLGEAMERQPNVRDAFETGRANLETELASGLLEKARGGNLVATIFLLKAMCGWKEGEPRDGVPKVAIQINLPPALSEAAYERVLTGQADARPA